MRGDNRHQCDPFVLGSIEDLLHKHSAHRPIGARADESILCLNRYSTSCLVTWNEHTIHPKYPRQAFPLQLP
jgi:hypothetical protein